VTASHRWHDLVVPERSRELLRGIVQQARGQAVRPEDGRAVMALFTGERGTGKTLAAQILGTDLGVPVIEVDAVAAAAEGVAALAVTAWRVLHDGARESSVIVFDDAGGLLGRGPVHRAEHEDVLDLTARCADYPGVVIFCSRIAVRLTPAEQERLAAIVPFPMPESPARAQLWRQFLPVEARLTGSDIDFIARSFRLPGGDIQACCLAAERIARDRGEPLSHAAVAAALEAHFRTWVLAPASRLALDALRDGEVAGGDGSASPVPATAVRRGPSLPWRRRGEREAG
jgi:hypothetical protein